MNKSRASEKKEYVRICPKCGSENTTGTIRVIQTAAGFSYCKSCDYEGIFPEIEKDKIEKFRKNLSRRKNENKGKSKNK